MSRIHVVAPGFLTTVQDLGRFGYAHFGISASGAADPLALRAGNLLVGNAENAAGLEMTLTGGEFASNWNDLSLGELFERIRISMPQNSPGSLSRQQNADILAYILSKASVPAGSTELPTQTEILNGIKFVGQKPAQ